MLAPEPYLSACLNVLYVAALEVRATGWNGEAAGLNAVTATRLAALSDAVHNLPYLISNWENCDEPWLRRSLAAYDEKWAGTGQQLLPAYESKLTKRLDPR